MRSRALAMIALATCQHVPSVHSPGIHGGRAPGSLPPPRPGGHDDPRAGVMHARPAHKRRRDRRR